MADISHKAGFIQKENEAPQLTIDYWREVAKDAYSIKKEDLDIFEAITKFPILSQTTRIILLLLNIFIPGFIK